MENKPLNDINSSPKKPSIYKRASLYIIIIILLAAIASILFYKYRNHKIFYNISVSKNGIIKSLTDTSNTAPVIGTLDGDKSTPKLTPEQIKQIAKEVLKAKKSNVYLLVSTSLQLLYALDGSNDISNVLENFKPYTKNNVILTDAYNEMYPISLQKIPTYDSLIKEISDLEDNIFKEQYKNSSSRLNKIKFYISKVIIIKKVSNFTGSDINSISYSLYLVNEDLKEKNAVAALNDLKLNNLDQMTILKPFITNLQKRIIIDKNANIIKNELINILVGL